MEEQLSIDKVMEEIKVVQSNVVGDLMHQLSIQRAINRQQEDMIITLRKRIEGLLNSNNGQMVGDAPPLISDTE